MNNLDSIKKLKQKVLLSDLDYPTIYQSLLDSFVETNYPENNVKLGNKFDPVVDLEYVQTYNSKYGKGSIDYLQEIYRFISNRLSNYFNYILHFDYSENDSEEIIKNIIEITNYIFWGGNHEIDYLIENIGMRIGHNFNDSDNFNKLDGMFESKKNIFKSILKYLLHHEHFDMFIRLYNEYNIFFTSRTLYDIIINEIFYNTNQVDEVELANIIEKWSYSFTLFVREELSKEIYLDLKLDENKEKMIKILLDQISNYFEYHKEQLANSFTDVELLDNIYDFIEKIKSEDSFLNYSDLYMFLDKYPSKFSELFIFDPKKIFLFNSIKVEYGRLLDFEFRQYLNGSDESKKLISEVIQNRIDNYYEDQIINILKSQYDKFSDEEIEKYTISFLNRNEYKFEDGNIRSINSDDVKKLYSRIKNNKDLCLIMAYSEKVFEKYYQIEENLIGGDFTSLVVPQIKAFERYLKEVIVNVSYKNNKTNLYVDTTKTNYNLSWNSKVEVTRRNKVHFMEYDNKNSIKIDDKTTSYNLSFRKDEKLNRLNHVNVSIGQAIEFIRNNYSEFKNNDSEITFRESIFNGFNGQSDRSNDIYKYWVSKVRNGYMHVHAINELDRAKEVNNNTAYWILRAMMELESL